MLKKQRHEIKLLTSFVTGHITLRAHLFRMGKVSSPSCRACGEGGSEEEPFHLFQKCARFDKLRQELQSIKSPLERTLAFAEDPEVQKLLVWKVEDDD